MSRDLFFCSFSRYISTKYCHRETLKGIMTHHSMVSVRLFDHLFPFRFSILESIRLFCLNFLWKFAGSECNNGRPIIIERFRFLAITFHRVPVPSAVAGSSKVFIFSFFLVGVEFVGVSVRAQWPNHNRGNASPLRKRPTPIPSGNSANFRSTEMIPAMIETWAKSKPAYNDRNDVYFN